MTTSPNTPTTSPTLAPGNPFLAVPEGPNDPDQFNHEVAEQKLDEGFDQLRPWAKDRHFSRLLSEAWLGLGDTSLVEINNPFHDRSPYEIDNPHVHLVNLMRQPQFFGFTAKYLFNIDLLPFQLAILWELWNRTYPILTASRGASKSFLLGIYCLLRATFNQGSKPCVVGSAFRQSKVVFEYSETIFRNAPVFRDFIGGGRENGPRHDTDRWTFRIGDSLVIALPLGTGEKIRGQRASHLLLEEFASIMNIDIIERIIMGFASVSSSPVDNVRKRARERAIKDTGLWTEAHEQLSRSLDRPNQTVISGTANYHFNHFYKYWKRYKDIIESRGDPGKLEAVFGGEVPENFNWRDYSIIQIPYDLLPDGFMDEKHIARAKATMHSAIFTMEFGARHIQDSDGFFRRSLIESCTVGKPGNPISLPSCGEIRFGTALQGNPHFQYVIGIDPASEQDNFALVVLEVWPDHRRIVHAWTTTRDKLRDKIKGGLVGEQDFYGHAARKIRDLMKVFPCARLAMDSQGGGIGVMEALHDPDKLQEGELPIWPVIVEDEEGPTDDEPGLHLLELVNFARADWVTEANHGLRKDFEDKVLLFPEFDNATLGLVLEEDEALGRKDSLYDSLEDAVLEIEELKDELATIVHSQTSISGRDRWDTPEIKIAGGRKGRLRKDRYSALLMANMAARVLARTPPPSSYDPRGGFAHLLRGRKTDEKTFIGPQWYVEHMKKNFSLGQYGAVVGASTSGKGSQGEHRGR